MPSLILLHGALGSAQTMQSLQQALAPDFDIHTLDFLGHGPSPAQAFDIPTLAQQVKNYIQSTGLEQPHIFGYSMGGYVALYLAQQMPTLVGRIITLGTKFAWSPEIAAKSIRGIQADKIEEKVPQFASYLKSLHGETEWRTLLLHTADMMKDLGVSAPLNTTNATQIANTALICLGDEDNMVSHEETSSFAEAMPQGQFQLLPQTQHPIQKVDSNALAPHLRSFLL
ncbi:MAG: alpha/beta fold hydrolase [Bacteroidota bacterium]